MYDYDYLRNEFNNYQSYTHITWDLAVYVLLTTKRLIKKNPVNCSNQCYMSITWVAFAFISYNFIFGYYVL